MIRQYMMFKVIPQLLQALNQTGKIPVRAADQDLYLFSLFKLCILINQEYLYRLKFNKLIEDRASCTNTCSSNYRTIMKPCIPKIPPVFLHIVMKILSREATLLISVLYSSKRRKEFAPLGPDYFQ